MKWLGTAACAAALAIACGNDESGVDGAGGGDGGRTSGWGGRPVMVPPAGAGGASLTFVVVDGSKANDDKWPTIAGAKVAFDAPDGARTELTSGSDGKVTFEGIDWSKGKASVTAHLDGYSLWSSVGLSETRIAAAPKIHDAWPLILVNRSPTIPKMVSVSGTATGFQDPAHRLIVNVANTTFPSSKIEWQGTSDATFTVSVPSDEPFMIQGFEMTPPVALEHGYDQPIHQMLQVSFDPITADKTGVVLDFKANAAAMKTADVWMTLPKRTDSPVRNGYPVGLVCPVGSIACTGWSTHVAISGDGNQVDDSLFWAEPSWATEPLTWIHVYAKAPGSIGANTLVSWRFVQTCPKAGLMGALPDSPQWVLPAESVSDVYPLHQPLEWKLFEEASYVDLTLLRGKTLVWMVEAGPNATSLTVPPLPSGVDPADVFGGTLQGSIRAGEVALGPAGPINRLEAAGVSASVWLEPPTG